MRRGRNSLPAEKPIADLTHIGQSRDDSSRLAPAPLSEEEVNKRLNEMIKLPELEPIEDQKPR
jgi:hypothetical protein